MQILHSKDGTPIAYKTTGNGPLLIITTGALNTHNFGVPGEMVPYLQDSFTVLTYDRRGRGQSGDTPPYTVYKELEDLDTLIEHHGGKANLYGHSSGAALALFAAAEFPEKVVAVAAYEPPVSGGWLERQLTNFFLKYIKYQVFRGENLALVTRFMHFVGMKEDLIAETLSGEHAQTIIDMAPTLAYELKIQRASKLFLQSRAKDLQMPVLMMAGTKSFKTAPGIMVDYTHAIPYAESHLLEGQTHSVEPPVASQVLKGFFLRT